MTYFAKLVGLPKMQHLTVKFYTRKKKERKQNVGEGGGVFSGKKHLKTVLDGFGRLSIFNRIFIDCNQRKHYSNFSIKYNLAYLYLNHFLLVLISLLLVTMKLFYTIN